MPEISKETYSTAALAGWLVTMGASVPTIWWHKSLKACKADIADFESIPHDSMRAPTVSHWNKYGIYARDWLIEHDYHPADQRTQYLNALRYTKKILTQKLVISSIVAVGAAIGAVYSYYKANQ